MTTKVIDASPGSPLGDDAIDDAMTAAAFRSLSPRTRGYVVYMMGARDDQPNVPDESNPYPAGTAEHREWDQGSWAAYLEVLDGEE